MEQHDSEQSHLTIPAVTLDNPCLLATFSLTAGASKVLLLRHAPGFCWSAVIHVHVAQAIEAAIERGLSRVEAGAQGEHKIQRGYLPSLTYSSHYIRDGRVSAAASL